MSIFDNMLERVDGPPEHGEGAFAYLTRSARTEAARVRQLVDSWLDRYPTAHREAIAARLRSAIDEQHRSAFFELFLHEFLLVTGHKILDIEPQLEGTTKSPDFLVEMASGERFYLEAVLATGLSDEERAAQKRLNQALAAVDRVQSPSHFLDVITSGEAAEPISIRKLQRAIGQWLQGIPADRRALGAAPFIYEQHGLRIQLRPFPRRNPRQNARAIGITHFAATEPVADSLRNALEKKAKRYGSLDLPYVVAVSASGYFHHDDDILEALFGTSYIASIEMMDGSMRTEERRHPDGMWCRRSGPRKRGLSAALSTERIDPWNFAGQRMRLVRNPWALRPLGAVQLPVDEFDIESGGFDGSNGRSMASVFGLPGGWPVL